MSTEALTILTVATNAAYLVPAYMLATRRLQAEAVFMLAVVLFSSLYHLCRDGSICVPGLDPLRWQLLDHLVANLALGQTILVAVTYKLRKRSSTTTTAARESGGVRARLDGYTLVSVRGAAAMRAAYAVSTITIIVLLRGTIGEYVGTIVLAVATLALAYVLSALRRTRRHSFVLVWRPYWRRVRLIAVSLAFVSMLLSGVLFFAEDTLAMPGNPARLLHAMWHVNGALTAALLVVGFADHFRVSRLPNLITPRSSYPLKP